MQIVIDIPEENYQVTLTKIILACRGCSIIELPKGHGRLIDADELKKHKYHDNDRFENAVAVSQIDWADTIIEADKVESEVEG